MEGDATLSVQIDEHREVAELRWDGATELIRVEAPESDNDAMSTIKDASYSFEDASFSKIIKIMSHQLIIISKCCQIDIYNEVMSNRRYYTVSMLLRVTSMDDGYRREYISRINEKTLPLLCLRQ